MRIAIVTDAWLPQVNGVVTTLGRTRDELIRAGHRVKMITPADHSTLPCPTYPEIRLSVLPYRRVRRTLDAFRPDCIHIATEGPLGFAARRYCVRRGLAFTTSYHTRFPQYVRERAPIPVSWMYAWLRRFHRPAAATLVPTPAVRDELTGRRFGGLRLWSRGVDVELFRPEPKAALAGPRPICLYMGRVAVEKNVEAFLQLGLPGTKYVVGDGPDLARLRAEFPDVVFTGYRFGSELAAHLAAADVFVFPSRTDTFGLVMLEAMACGTPVAAYPVTGPLDVIEQGRTGVLHEDLGVAIRRALTLDRGTCRQAALEKSWARATAEFLGHLAGNDAVARQGDAQVLSTAVDP
ncbi:glycosyltransferase family 4 protein [Lentisalinibacter orientalis]|uniref:glycosyltransferase family 4 protein n=1 Tax=Lentisalinibacter orientalis TaxID=2992241 RepID=UPI003869DAAF